jgi:hypothetical protein
VRHAKRVTIYAATVVAGRTTSHKVTLKAAKALQATIAR